MNGKAKIWFIVIGVIVVGGIALYSGGAELFQGRMFSVSKPLPAYDGNRCYESDGGKNFDEKGTIYGKISRSEFGNRTDFCTTATDVKEYYCDGKYVKNEDYSCENGCDDGACNKSYYNQVFTGSSIVADNGISVRLKGIYNTPIDGNKMIELDFYIGDQKLNIYRNFYRLWDGVNLKPSQLILEDYGVKLSFKTTLPTANSLSVKIESKFDKNFTSGQELYDQCLQSPPQYKNEGLSGYPLAVLCTKYYSSPKVVPNDYKVTYLYGFTIISKQTFSQNQVESFVKLLDEYYGKMQTHLGYAPTATMKPVIYMDDDVNHPSITINWLISIRSMPWWTFSDVNSTDMTHELVHWFAKSIEKPYATLEEGYAVYNDFLIRLSDGKDVFLQCNDNDVVADLGGGKFSTTYGSDPYSLGLCFWKELKDGYPLVFEKIQTYWFENRIPGNTEKMLLTNVLKDNVSNDFFELLKSKYLTKMTGGNDIFNMTFQPNPGWTMQNYW